MRYETSLDTFDISFGNKFSHITGKRFKLFPYVANNNTPVVEELEYVANNFINILAEQEPEQIDEPSFVSNLTSLVEISSNQNEKDTFANILKTLFFDSNGNLLPINLLFRAQSNSSKNEEKKLAEYLSDVFGQNSELKVHIDNAFNNIKNQSSVIEQFVMDQFVFHPIENSDKTHYYPVSRILYDPFQEDLQYILKNEKLTNECLVPLLEMYYFNYTAQACFQLDRFEEGERDKIHPLFYCLDWETTSSSRSCYDYGWRSLQSHIERMYNHAVTLELLNQTVDGCETFDYIALCEIAGVSDELDSYVYEQVKKITDLYRSKIPFCLPMEDYKRKPVNEISGLKTTEEIRYLYNSVRLQFENTSRNRACRAYYANYEKYSNKFLRPRGRNGKMLALSEEQLLLLTRLCIKDDDKIRLNKVFSEFERRGIFLDNQSKKQVMKYYEKLNLIEKKSDSGDAMYVKRIL